MKTELKVITTALIFTFISVAYSSAKALSFHVIRPKLESAISLSDGQNEFETFSLGDKREIILDLKNRSYIKSVEVVAKAKVEAVYFSYDFAQWNVATMNSTEGARFIKIVFSSSKPKIAEVKIIEANGVKISFDSTKVEKGQTSALVEWKTSHDSTSYVRYSEPGKENKTMMDLGFTKKHRLEISQLRPGTQYFLDIIAQSVDGKISTAEKITFTTLGDPLPEIISIKEISKTYTHIKLKVSMTYPTKLTYTLYSPIGEKLYEGKSVGGVSKDEVIELPLGKALSPYFVVINGIDDKNRKLNGGKHTRYDFISGENNVALGAKVTGTFGEKYIGDKFLLEGDVLSRVTDGSFDYKTGMAVSSDPNKANQWVVVDLGKEYDIEKVLVYWRALAYPLKYMVTYSTDGRNWSSYSYKNESALKDGAAPRKPYGRALVRNSTDSSLIEYEGGAGVPMIINRLTSNGEIKARYIKVEALQGFGYYKRFKFYNFLEIMEVKVYPKMD